MEQVCSEEDVPPHLKTDKEHEELSVTKNPKKSKFALADNTPRRSLRLQEKRDKLVEKTKEVTVKASKRQEPEKDQNCDLSPGPSTTSGSSLIEATPDFAKEEKVHIIRKRTASKRTIPNQANEAPQVKHRKRSVLVEEEVESVPPKRGRKGSKQKALQPENRETEAAKPATGRKRKVVVEEEETSCSKAHTSKQNKRPLVTDSGGNTSTDQTSLEEDQFPPKKKVKTKNRKHKTAEQSLENLDSIRIVDVPTAEVGVVSKGKGKSTRRREKQKGKRHSAIRKSVIQYVMSKKSSKDGQPGPSGESQKDTPPGDQATGNSSAGGDVPEPLDPFMALMNEETKHLQMMLESRGLPPHLLGSLGPRMPHLFSKHMSSSNNTRAQQLLEGLRCVEDESVQLQSCIEVGQLLVMGNEDTLSGFPVKETVPALINLLSMEHNFDMMMNASRALTYMMEALPRSTVVVADAIPVLLGKLQVIECMDVAEQALSALDILSRKHSKAILQEGGVNACLFYLDFFSLTTQRSALSVAANCCLSVSEEEYHLVADSISILSGRLHHQDKKSVESCCLCFSRLVENFANHPEILQKIASQGLLPNVQNLLVMSPPVISASMFVTVVRMLSTLCSVSPIMAVELLRLNIAETLKYLLIGAAEEITLDNIEIHSRSSNEVYEIVSLISELLPPLPKDGIFEVDSLLVSTTRRPIRVTVQWEWQTDNGTWRPYSRVENRQIEAAHMSGEDEVPIDIGGRTYVVEFGTMQQFNEETGTARSVRRNAIDLATAEKDDSAKKGKDIAEEDPREVVLCAEPDLCTSFMQSLFAVLFEEFNNMAAPSVKHRCLKALLRMLNSATPEILTDILRDIAVSSYIATMLKSCDYRIVVGAIQMANVLINKLPEIFLVYFHREGVMHVMETLKSLPLKAINTPKKPDPPKQEQRHLLAPSVIPVPIHTNPIVPIPSFHMSMPHPHVPPPSNAPPKLEGATGFSNESPSTARRFVDMFRRSKRQLRKSFTRSRSEDTMDPPPPPFPFFSVPNRPLPSMPMIHVPPHVPHSSTTPSLLPPPPPNPQSNAAAVPGDKEQPQPKSSGLTVPGPSEEGQSVKEKIRDWIQNQVISFLEKWSVGDSSADKNPALEVMKNLQKTVDALDPSSAGCLDAIKEVCELLVNPVTSVSAFELMHCQLPHVLHQTLSNEGPKMAVPLTVRLRHFLHVFIGLPEEDSELSSWVPQEKPGLLTLLVKLHKCINQTESFPIRVFDTQGRRGSHAMKFFNSHQIKCNLEVHPSATGLRKFKGGTVRVDPLATMQAVERYLILKGVTTPEQQKSSDDTDGSDDSEPDEGMLPSMIPGPTKRQLEFLINDHVIPHNMTVFQAVKVFGSIGAEESEEEMASLGNPEIWIRSHLIHYRSINQGEAGMRPKRSFSVPVTPFGGVSLFEQKYSHSISVESATHGSKARRNLAASRLGTPSRPDMRVTRSMSREQHQERRELFGRDTHQEVDGVDRSSSPDELCRKLSPLIHGIRNTRTGNFSMEDPSLPVIKLIGILYLLNSHWNDLYNGSPGNPIVSMSEFVNVKLTSKATRQLQDPLNVMTGNFPDWLKELAKQCPFLFPFEYRQTFFYLTSFDRDRAILRLQEQQPELTATESNERITPKLEKKKRCVSRDGLLHQAERIMEEVGSSRALLEIQYQDEVGTGLGPTLEFYTLVSRELQQANLQMWRGDPCPLPGSSSSQASNVAGVVTQYIHSPVGLFPAPLAGDTSFGVVEEICSKFRFLGCFMAKAIMDSRMLDLPLSEAFYKWILGQEQSFTAQDLQHVDPVLSRSFAQLADVAVRKHHLESDPLLAGKALQVGIESLTLDGGGSVEDLDLDFTLPGYPYIELKPHGKELPVTIHNLDEYLKLVVDWTLVKGVSRQMEAFREGFNKVFPVSSLQQFYPHEMDILLCGANNQKWDIKELVENCRPDHGYTHDSQAVQFLFQVLSSYNTSEQRQFIQFVTGCPRLPVGGFKALNPPLTIVRKTVEGQIPNNFLPSVMTCVNYLKLPDYTSKEVMKERLDVALREGKHSFHLS